MSPEQQRLSAQIEFIVEIDKLKGVERRNPLIDGSRVENTAEHSWHLVMMALVLTEHADTPVDPLRVLSMVAVHDLVEIDAGDTYAYDPVGASTKAAREQEAAARIFSLLPGDQGERLRGLWEEFEYADTPEARFARALDRLMPLLHNHTEGGSVWRSNGVDAGAVRARQSTIGEGSMALWDLACSLIDASVAAGHLPEGP